MEMDKRLYIAAAAAVLGLVDVGGVVGRNYPLPRWRDSKLSGRRRQYVDELLNASFSTILRGLSNEKRLLLLCVRNFENLVSMIVGCL